MFGFLLRARGQVPEIQGLWPIPYSQYGASVGASQRLLEMDAPFRLLEAQREWAAWLAALSSAVSEASSLQPMPPAPPYSCTATV